MSRRPRLALAPALLLAACGASPDSHAPSAPPPSSLLQAGAPWPKFRGNERQDGLAGFAPRAGGVAFTFRTGRGVFSSPVVGADGTVYFGSADGWFYALDRGGKVRWKVETGGVIDSAALLDDRGRVYFGSGDGRLRALRAEDGAPEWSFEADPPRVSQAFIRWFEGNVALSPRGDLYAPNDNFFVYALDRDAGTVRWRHRMGDQTWSSPAVDLASGRLYLGNNHVGALLGSNLYGLLATGASAWRTSTAGTVAASPLLADGLVVVGSFDGQLRAFEAGSGRLRWRFATRDHLYASPARLPDGTLVQPGADGTVYGIDLGSGALRWRFDTREPLRSSPAVDGLGRVYLGTGEGRLLVLGPDGGFRWALQLIEGDRDDLNSSPALGRDAVYLGGESGELFSVPYDYCLGPAGERDARCLRRTDPPEPDGATLRPVSAFGSERRGAPERIDPNQPLAFALRVRHGGQAVEASIDPTTVEVTVTPPVAIEREVSGDGQFLVVTPAEAFAADPAGRVRLAVSAAYRVGQRRDGLRRSGGTIGGVATIALEPRLADREGEPGAGSRASSPAAEGAVGTTYAIDRVSLPLPTLVASYNQIGFDAMALLVTVVERDGGRGVAWMVGATGAGGDVRADPASRLLLPLALAWRPGGYLQLEGGGLTMEVNQVAIPFRSFRLAADVGALATAAEGPALARLTGTTVCGGIPLYGYFLARLGLCNPVTDVLLVHGAADLRALPTGRAPAASTGPAVSWSVAGDRLTARLGAPGLVAAEHLAALLVVDEASGRPLPLDPRTAFAREVDPAGRLLAVSARLPAPVPERVRAYLMLDTAAAARATLTLPR